VKLFGSVPYWKPQAESALPVVTTPFSVAEVLVTALAPFVWAVAALAEAGSSNPHPRTSKTAARCTINLLIGFCSAYLDIAPP
jgi:hypothetical protein